MLLVADSGSTKADWLLYDGESVQGPIRSMGFNPYFHSSSLVFETLSQSEEMNAIREKVRDVRFFGAGCSSAEMNEIIAIGLRRFFQNADILVEHDLLACAYATCGDEPGISCILGTGSNACYFDGKHVHEKNYGLGYVLGDEGSGSYFGKKLLSYFLYGMMPPDLSADFFSRYKLNKSSVVDHVYRQPNPNTWMASFTYFLSAHREHAWIKTLLRKGFSEFLELTACQFENHKSLPVHFVGSIAFLYQDELKEVAQELQLQPGRIIKQPVDALMDYFIRKG
jgi:N-acetylglucosamine kinase-like BadF-type ATPase